MEDPYIIDSLEKLREHYIEPHSMVTKATLTFLHDHMIEFIRRVPLIVLSSETEEGLDASPRGGEPGFVKIIDRKTVVFGDWLGNNKLETISNIIQTGRCGMLLLVPKLDMFLRLNGSATVTRSPELLKVTMEINREPKSVVKVSVEHAYFHCGKALKRSRVWDPESWAMGGDFPMVGKIMSDLVKLPEYTPEQLEEMYQHALKEELY